MWRRHRVLLIVLAAALLVSCDEYKADRFTDVDTLVLAVRVDGGTNDALITGVTNTGNPAWAANQSSTALVVGKAYKIRVHWESASDVMVFGTAWQVRRAITEAKLIE